MFDHKRILITGGTGSWANELITQLLGNYFPEEVIVYSRGEQKQVEMKHNFSGNPIIKYVIGDVRDKQRLERVMMGVDYVFHMAALKHVPVCEENPWDTVLTNIYGTQNVIDASIKNNVKKVIQVSTDKAVDPLNLYGVTKQCAEKLIIAANHHSPNTRFVCVRGGNVIGSAGSVVPLFREQIRKNNEITITDERMTRFFLTLSQAIKLVFKSVENSVGGEVFVLKMPAAKITDLAEVMVETLGNQETKSSTIGIRPGEKIHEVLVSRYESHRTVEEDGYFIILPIIKIPGLADKYFQNKKIDLEEFNSQNTHVMDKIELKKVLEDDGWLGELSESGFLGKVPSQDLKFKDRKWL
jgi:FlaA1/EpsC-like NDP-sugar epimerase|tara:strand:- start:16528 stop:17592 length:1065 start_codon:yes stop_codon:yes gene_type:complete